MTPPQLNQFPHRRLDPAAQAGSLAGGSAGDSAGDSDPRLLAALEQPPAVRIPADFAARVAALAMAGQPALATRIPMRPGFARLALWAGALVLLVAMLGLAASTPHGAVALLAQSLLVLEFAALVLVRALRPRLLG